MFMLGVFWGAEIAPSTMVLLEQTLKNLRRHYRIETVMAALADLPFTGLAERVAEVFEDRRYAGWKRVFSQDRRPAKRIKVKPRIVLAPAAETTEAADALRDRQLPVECVICREQVRWQKMDYQRICLGHNYYVPPEELAGCLASVEGEKRLRFPTGSPGAAPLVASIRAAAPQSAAWPPEGSAMALAAVVWFSETVKSVKRYGQAG